MLDPLIYNQLKEELSMSEKYLTGDESTVPAAQNMNENEGLITNEDKNVEEEEEEEEEDDEVCEECNELVDDCICDEEGDEDDEEEDDEPLGQKSELY